MWKLSRLTTLIWGQFLASYEIHKEHKEWISRSSTSLQPQNIRRKLMRNSWVRWINGKVYVKKKTNKRDIVCLSLMKLLSWFGFILILIFFFPRSDHWMLALGLPEPGIFTVPNKVLCHSQVWYTTRHADTQCLRKHWEIRVCVNKKNLKLLPWQNCTICIL